jgi:hypothetical protein
MTRDLTSPLDPSKMALRLVKCHSRVTTVCSEVAFMGRDEGVEGDSWTAAGNGTGGGCEVRGYIEESAVLE